MIAQKGQRTIELEAQLAELKQHQLKVVLELQNRSLDSQEEALLKEKLKLLSKLEVPIFMLLTRYKGKERKRSDKE
jgi:hypothetical protein